VAALSEQHLPALRFAHVPVLAQKLDLDVAQVRSQDWIGRQQSSLVRGQVISARICHVNTPAELTIECSNLEFAESSSDSP
jgi:hypothetical protein